MSHRALTAALLVGTSNSRWGSIALPYDLTANGAPGCMIVNDAALIVLGTTVPAASGRVLFQGISPVPDPSLVGTALCTQVAFLDAAANALGAFTTNGSVNTIPPVAGVAHISSFSTASSMATYARRPDYGVSIALN